MTSELTVALDGVYLSINRLKAKQAKMLHQLNNYRRAQRQKLDETVFDLLPEITTKVRTRLQTKCPGFVTGEVSTEFDLHLSRWASLKQWIFQMPTIYESLTFLQVNLRQYLEQHEPLLHAAAITKIDNELLMISNQLGDMHKLVQPMQHAVDTGVSQFKPEVRNAISQLALRTKQVERHEVTDDTDLWMWMMTDIPTSFRTMLLDASVHDHHQQDIQYQPTREGSFGGAGASGSFEPTVDSTPNEANVSSVETAPLVSMQDGADLGLPPMQQIATDDSLGVFS